MPGQSKVLVRSSAEGTSEELYRNRTKQFKKNYGVKSSI
jgi:hypothetical protein